MRKSILISILTLFTVTFSPQFVSAATPDPITTIDPGTKELPARVQVLLARVDEIRAMDKSTLTRVERKELRKELRTINTELKSTGNGIYLSIGAIIIIILLLILIL